jgi:hypothetical protein
MRAKHSVIPAKAGTHLPTSHYMQRWVDAWRFTPFGLSEVEAFT